MFSALIVGGLAAGFLAGMFGIGGGAIVIPLLMHLYVDAGMDGIEAIRLAFTGYASFLTHRKRGNVDSLWYRRLFLPPARRAVPSSPHALPEAGLPLDCH